MDTFTGKRSVLGSVLALYVALVGCQRADESLSTSGDHLRPDWGVVLPIEEQAKLPEYCAGPSPSGLAGQWMPGRAEIDRLERRLPGVIGKALTRVILEKGEKRPRPADYYRQYAAFYRNGRRVIYVCGLHRGLVAMTEKTIEPQAWMRRAMGADDGGLAILHVVYDVDADEFGPVQFEGRFSGPVRSRWF
jgi:hypothetical protein